MLPWRVPSALVILTVSGVDGRPGAGRTISDEMLRCPGQLRWMTGLAVSAVQGTPAVPLIRLAGNPAGGAPAAPATLTCSTPGLGGRISESSSASRPGPGRASAAACSRRVCRAGHGERAGHGRGGRRVGERERRRHRLGEREDRRRGLLARRILGGLEQADDPDAGDQHVGDARARIAQDHPPGGGDRDAQPAGPAG